MATTHCTGPDFSTPGTTEGQVRGDGRHKLASASTYSNAYFSLANGSSDEIASGTGALKLEWYAEDKLNGGVWDVYIAPHAATPWYKVGTITQGAKASPTAPTFSSVTSAKAGSATLNRQQETIIVPLETMQAVDDAASIKLKFVPRNNRGLVLTAAELTFTS